MIDELDRLRHSAELQELLQYYADLGRADRQIWHDRLPAIGATQGKELTRLYGELLAFGWVEQNTGVTPFASPDRVPQCYRVTTAGQRALRLTRTEEYETAGTAE